MPKNTGLFPGGTTSAHAENTIYINYDGEEEEFIR